MLRNLYVTVSEEISIKGGTESCTQWGTKLLLRPRREPIQFFLQGSVQCRIFIDNIIRLDLTELPNSIFSLSKGFLKAPAEASNNAGDVTRSNLKRISGP